MDAEVGWSAEHCRMDWGADQCPAVNDEDARKGSREEGEEQHQGLWQGSQLGRNGAERKELSERREAEPHQKPWDRRIATLGPGIGQPAKRSTLPAREEWLVPANPRPDGHQRSPKNETVKGLRSRKYHEGDVQSEPQTHWWCRLRCATKIGFENRAPVREGQSNTQSHDEVELRKMSTRNVNTHFHDQSREWSSIFFEIVLPRYDNKVDWGWIELSTELSVSKNEEWRMEVYETLKINWPTEKTANTRRFALRSRRLPTSSLTLKSKHVEWDLVKRIIDTCGWRIGKDSLWNSECDLRWNEDAKDVTLTADRDALETYNIFLKYLRDHRTGGMWIVHSRTCLQDNDLSFSTAKRFCCLFFFSMPMQLGQMLVHKYGSHNRHRYLETKSICIHLHQSRHDKIIF